MFTVGKTLVECEIMINKSCHLILCNISKWFRHDRTKPCLNEILAPSPSLIILN